jgi:hypothetical protein
LALKECLQPTEGSNNRNGAAIEFFASIRPFDTDTHGIVGEKP